MIKPAESYPFPPLLQLTRAKLDVHHNTVTIFGVSLFCIAPPLVGFAGFRPTFCAFFPAAVEVSVGECEFRNLQISFARGTGGGCIFMHFSHCCTFLRFFNFFQFFPKCTFFACFFPHFLCMFSNFFQDIFFAFCHFFSSS